MRKLFAILTLALAALWVAPATAFADPLVYPPAVAAGAVSSGTVTAGGSVDFSGGGFAPGATVTIEEDGELEGTVTAGPGGRFSTTVTIDGVGTSVLTATGAGADGGTLVVTATVRVLAASGGAGGAGGSDADDSSAGAGAGSDNGLPRTGSEGTAAQVWAGIGLLGLGAGMIALTVSRRRVGTTSTIA